MKKFLGTALLVLMIPTAAVAKGGIGDRIAVLEANVATLQSDVAALRSGQDVNVSAIAANAAAIAANAAAIAVDAAAIAANSEAIAVNASAVSANTSALVALDTKVMAHEEYVAALSVDLSLLYERVSSLEQSDIPIYSTASELPTDGSVLLAFFEPKGGIYETADAVDWELAAHRWLMVFDGVTTIFEGGGGAFTDVDGFGHAFPNGWYPAARGASGVEGLVPVGAIAVLNTAISEATGNPNLGRGVGTTVGIRIQEMAAWLAYYISFIII